MTFQLGRGFHNPLLSRVRRHSSLATLFRAPSAPALTPLITLDQQLPAVPEMDSGVVQATLGGIEGEVLLLPSIHPASRLQERSDTRTPQSRQIPESVTAENTVVQPQASIPQDTAQSTITPQATDTATSPSEADSNTPITDSVWRRLQTIFQRHQQRPGESPQTVQKQPDLDESKTVEDSDMTSSPDEGISKPESEQIRESPGRTQTALPAQNITRPGSTIQRTAVTDGEQQQIADESDQPPSLAKVESLEVMTQEHALTDSTPPVPGVEEDRGEVLPASTLPTSPSSQILSKAIVETGHASSQPSIIQPAPDLSEGEQHADWVKETQAPPSVRNAEAVSPSPVIKRTTDQTVSRETIPQAQRPTMRLEDASEESPQQDVPLQDVWQVEHLAPPSATPLQGSGAVIESESLTGGELQASISRVLERVAAGGPTSSSIEVVAPRHPRPVTQTASTQSIIRRQPAEPREQQEPSATTHDSRLSESEDVVDTAIGPLPADLWTLIDEPVPPTVKSQSVISDRISGQTTLSEEAVQDQPDRRSSVISQARPDAVIQTRPDRKVSTLTRPVASDEIRPVGTPSARTSSQAPSRIQRVAEQYGGSTQTSDVEQRSTASLDETSSAQEQQQEETPDEGGIDIDDLARKVYAELKRKLAVEWERLRTRF